MIPSLGRIVLYTLSASDAAAVNKRRADATANISLHREGALGVVVHAGNSVREGDELPLVITRCWGDGEAALVNGQVLLDGNDTLWVTSVAQGEGARTWRQPPRV